MISLFTTQGRKAIPVTYRGWTLAQGRAGVTGSKGGHFLPYFDSLALALDRIDAMESR